MINFKINNFLGVRRAVIELHPGRVTEITGENNQGKSSIALAVAGILAGNTNPLGVAATKNYLAYGITYGKITAVRGGESWEWNVATGKISNNIGSNKSISTAGPVGLVDFVSPTTTEQRAQIWADLLFPKDNDYSDLQAELDTEGYNPNEMIEYIKSHGFQEAYSVAKKQALENKRLFSDAATSIGERVAYGAKVGIDWRPAGWTNWHEPQTVASVEAQILEIKARGLASPEKKSVKLAQQIEASKSMAGMLAKDIYKIDKQLQNLGGVSETPPPEQQYCECPNCKKFQAKIVCDWCRMGKDKEAEELTFLGNRDQELRKSLKYENSELIKIEEALAAAVKEEIAHDAVADQQRLDEIKKLETLAKMITARGKANLAAENARKYERISHILNPKSGYQARKMATAREAFNQKLGWICERTGWPQTEVNEVNQVVVAGKEVQFLSASERWRVQIMLQVCLARMAGESWVVVDGADILDDENERVINKFLKDITEPTGIGVLLCRTSGDKEPFSEGGLHYHVVRGEVVQGASHAGN